MDTVQFDHELLEAYRAERAAAVTLQGLIDAGLAGEERILAALFLAVETLVGDRLEPLIRRRGLPADLDEARLRGARERARSLGDWAAVVGSLGRALDDHVRRYEALWAAAPACDRPALRLLVDHEIALIRFGSLLQAGEVAEAKALLGGLLGDNV